MKKLIPVLLMLSVSAVAQTKNSSFFDTHLNRAKNVATPKSGNKTTATYWRLAATSDYSFDGTSLELSDSTNYKYSNGRGSALSFRDLEANDYGLQSDIKYDTAVKYGDNGSGIQPYSRYMASYNSNNVSTVFTEQNSSGQTFQNSSEIRGEYDSNGNLIKEFNMFWNASKWDTSRITEYTYDSQKKLLKDSSYYYNQGSTIPSSVVLYTYDGNGNMTYSLERDWSGSTYDSSYRTINTYSSNNIVTSIEQEYIDTAWHNQSFDSTGYTSGGIYNYNVYKEWDSLAADWVNIERETRTVNGNGITTGAAFSEWDDNTGTWETMAEAEVFYNTNGDPFRVDIYAYIGGIKLPTPLAVRNMYYEYYYNVGVAATPKTQTITVYPNPASSHINIVLNGKQATIQLTNMAGQTVRSIAANGGEQVARINLAGLPAGNYIMTVAGADAPQRQMITIQ